jgi:hypothetical protein
VGQVQAPAPPVSFLLLTAFSLTTVFSQIYRYKLLAHPAGLPAAS